MHSVRTTMPYAQWYQG